MSSAPQNADTAAALDTVLGLLAAPAVAVDGAGLVVAANEAGASRLAAPIADVVGRPIADAVPDAAGATHIVLSATAGAATLLVWPMAGVVDEAMIDLQRADAVGRLAGGISHDMRNKLGGMLTYADTIATDPGLPPDLADLAGVMHDEVDAALQMVHTTLELARRRPTVKNRVSVGPLVRECLDLAKSATLQLQVRATVSEVMPELEVDQAKLRQAIVAVLLAAVESMGGTWVRSGPTATGSLRIAGYLAEDDGRYRARLTFDDTGEPVPEQARATLFDGVGGRATRDLAVAAALVSSAGGRLDYEAIADGNRLILELPLAGDPPLPRRTAPAPRPVAPAAQPQPSARGSAGDLAGALTAAAASPSTSPAGARPLGPDGKPTLTVLVCDDEPSIRGLLVRVIARGGHRAIEASGGAEALVILNTEPVDLVMADQRMADMTGVDLYRAAVESRPELAARFVLMSGDAGTPELVEFAAATGLQVIEKPFDLGVVTATLRRLAGG